MGSRRVALLTGNDSKSSSGRGRCPPCLLSPRGHPRISPCQQRASRARRRRTGRQAAGRSRPSPPLAPTSARTSGWLMSFTSAIRPTRAQWTGPGGASSLTTSRGRRRHPPVLPRQLALRRPVLRMHLAGPRTGRTGRRALARARLRPLLRPAPSKPVILATAPRRPLARRQPPPALRPRPARRRYRPARWPSGFAAAPRGPPPT